MQIKKFSPLFQNKGLIILLFTFLNLFSFNIFANEDEEFLRQVELNRQYKAQNDTAKVNCVFVHKQAMPFLNASTLDQINTLLRKLYFENNIEPYVKIGYHLMPDGRSLSLDYPIPETQKIYESSKLTGFLMNIVMLDSAYRDSKNQKLIKRKFAKAFVLDKDLSSCNSLFENKFNKNFLGSSTGYLTDVNAALLADVKLAISVTFECLKSKGTLVRPPFPIVQSFGNSFPQLNTANATPNGSTIADYAGVSESERKRLESQISGSGLDMKVYITSDANKDNKVRLNKETGSISDFDFVKNKFDNNDEPGEKDVSMWIHYDPQTKQAYIKIRYNYKKILTLPNIPIKPNGEQPSEDEVRKEVSALLSTSIENAINFKRGLPQNYLDKALSAPSAVVEFIRYVQSISNDLKLPEQVWKDQYKDNVIRLHPLGGGITDGAIQIVKDIPDAVAFGLSMCLDDEQSKKFYDAIASIDAEVIASGLKSKIDKYTGPADIAQHELGQDAVQLAEMFYGGAFIKGAKGAGDKAEDLARKAGKKVGGALSDALKKAIKKRLGTKGDELIGDLANSENKLLKDIFEDAPNDRLNELIDAWDRISECALRVKPEYLELVKGLSKKWTIKADKNSFKIFNNDDELAEIFEGLVKSKAGSKGKWNEFLNKPLLRKHTYEVDHIIYVSDDYGRINKTSCDLELVERGRYESQQGLSVSLKDGIKGQDDGGHLIANILNGPGEQINYLPMKLTLNRGDWKSMESIWAKALSEGKKVSVEILPIFESASKRPAAFQVNYYINGIRERKFFEN